MSRPQKPPATNHETSWTAWGVSILNGFFGDYLRERSNGLATEMACYHQDQPFPLRPSDLQHVHPTPTPKIVVFVHGLACNEGSWTFRDTACAPLSYGSMLKVELGYTPFYVRYNTGLPIAENGRALAALINELVAGYPTPVDEIVLVGHSMGGLVLRSASHEGSARGHSWVERVSHVFYLGSPHDGADLEKAAYIAAATLHAIPNPITRIVGAALDLRSQGVKDLRTGKLLDEEDVDAPPWLSHARHYLIVGTLTDDPQHIVSLLFGDALVRVPSASGKLRRAASEALPLTHIKVFPGVHHMGLANDPLVYQQIKAWLDDL